MRVVICQPMVPAYRVPLFERLASLPDVELTIYAGGDEGSLRAATSLADAYVFRSAPVRLLPLGLRLQFATPGVLRQRPDLLIAQWDIRYLNTLPLVLAARMRRVPVVLWGHGYSRRPRWLTDAARNACGRLADGVLLYTKTVAAKLVASGELPRERVFVAQNALDQTPIQRARGQWMADTQTLRDFQHAHGLDAAQTLIFVSRLEPGNRVDLLLEAVARLRDRFERLRLVVIGDGSARADLERKSGQLGIGANVIYLGALYDEERLAPWMLSSVAFCYPTNIGLSLLHAFGYGLPVITSANRSSQNPEIEALRAGHNGLEYRDGDVDDLARQCARLLAEPELRVRLGRNALDTVLQEYSLDHMLDGFKRVIEWVRTRPIATRT